MNTLLIKKTILAFSFFCCIGLLSAQQLHVEHVCTSASPTSLFEDTSMNNFTRVFWGNTNSNNQWRISSRAYTGGSAFNIFDFNFYDGSSAINFMRMNGDDLKIVMNQDIEMPFDRMFVGAAIPVGGFDTQTHLETPDKLISTYISNSYETGSSTNGLLVQNLAIGAGDRTGIGTFAISVAGDAFGTYSFANSSAGGNEYGVYGEANGPSGTSWGIFSNGDLYYTGSFTAPSDKRLKKNIENLDTKSVLSKLSQLKSKTYEYDLEKYPSMNFAKGKQIGFLAQDIQALFPEVVQEQRHVVFETPGDRNSESSYINILGVDYIKMIPILTTAIQEQVTEIEDLRKENEAIKSELEALKALVHEIAGK